MSDVDNSITSILLPASSVAVYSKEQATLQAARDLENDWRFARVRIYAEEGDVKTAIENIRDCTSPDLLIVQTDTIDSSFTEKLSELAGYCDEGTSAIVIGPDNDVNLYRRLVDMGVSDYLVRPVETRILAEVIAKGMIEKIGVTGSRLIAFLGAKGGVGASILSEAAACGVSDILGEKTVLLDVAGGWSTFGIGLGFEPNCTLSQAVRAAEKGDEGNLERMMFKSGDRLSVLATGGDAMLDSPVEAGQAEKLIDMLMAKYPVVIADLSQSSEMLKRVVIGRANQIIVVATPTLPALRLARGLMSEIREIRGGSMDGLDLVINMQGMHGSGEVSRGDIEKAMECPVAACLPFDPRSFLVNESESRKLTDDKNARGLIEKTLLPVIARTLGVSAKGGERAASGNADSGLFGGILKKLSSK